MFKERLRIVLKEISIFVVMFGLAAIILGLLLWGMITFEWLEKIMEYILYGMVAIIILLAIIMIIMKISKFINWLFIEPIKHKKTKGDGVK